MVSKASSPGATPQHFQTLDTLRGLFALVVAVFHFRSSGELWRLEFVQNAFLALDFFFVLSGFVITHSYAAKLASGAISVWRYMGLRLGRIYPLHIAILAVWAALELVLVFAGEALSGISGREPFVADRSLGALIQSVFLIQAFGFPGNDGWNVPAWSIAAEFWTYLLFAFVMLANLRSVLVMSLMVSAAMMAVMMSYSPDIYITLNGGVWRAMCGFGIGVLTYHAFRRWGGVGGTLWEIAAVAGIIAFMSLAQGFATFASPLFFAFIIVMLAQDRGVIAWLCARPAVAYLGTISYTIYMVHIFVQARFLEGLEVTGVIPRAVASNGLTYLDGPPIISDCITLAMLGIVVLVSHVAYRYIEEPGRQWSRRILRNSKVVSE